MSASVSDINNEIAKHKPRRSTFEYSSGYNEDTQTITRGRVRVLTDDETGEKVHADEIRKYCFGRKQFWKVYLMDFLTILGVFDSKQVDILIYILENTSSSNNLFIGTQRKIEKDTGVSRPTIVRAMNKLREHNFIKKVQNGVYQVNPQIFIKGNENKQHMLISYYKADEPIAEITKAKTKKVDADEQDG